MLLPHQPEFRHRPAVLAWTTAVCLIASLAWPERSLADHVLAPLYGAFGALVTYVLLRLFLTGLALFAEERFPQLALVYILVAFYGGILGTTLGLVIYPFQLHSLHSSQMSVAYYISTLPLGFFMAAAALPVLEKYYYA